MNEGRDVWSGGNSAEKSDAISKSLRTTLDNLHRPQQLFPKKKRMTEIEIAEKQIADEFEAIKKRVAEREGLIEKSDESGEEVIEKSDFPNGSFATDGSGSAPAEDLEKIETTAHGKPIRSLEHRRRAKKAWQKRQPQAVMSRETRQREAPEPEHKSFEERIDAVIGSSAEESPLEKAIKQSGFDKLPMTDKARELLENVLSNGAEPVTQYTGKVLIERGIPEVPPASLSKIKSQLDVGDRVIPLHWVPVGPVGAVFDLPYVPPTARITRMYKGPAKVTKDVYSPGRAPKDCENCESVVEERLWALDLEPEGDEKHADNDDAAVPSSMSDTTMVLRLEPLAQPSGEVAANL